MDDDGREGWMSDISLGLSSRGSQPRVTIARVGRRRGRLTFIDGIAMELMGLENCSTDIRSFLHCTMQKKRGNCRRKLQLRKIMEDVTKRRVE